MLLVRVLTRADGLEDVALGDDSGARLLGVEHDRGADSPLRHLPRGVPERVTRPHCQDRFRHAVPYEHLPSSMPICDKRRKGIAPIYEGNEQGPVVRLRFRLPAPWRPRAKTSSACS